ncbi:MAG: NAD(P)/FAD-dependent oxidoreductase, partial [Acidimicrobiaceae bacterium]
EGFTSRLKSHRRTLAPLYSYMVATEPLTSRQLSNLGWQNRETYHDARNMIIYAQLTKDKRIAFGGRGAPYHFASRVKPQYDMHTDIHEKIIRSMRDVFNVSRELKVTHRWGGPLGVPRNWKPTVNFEPKTGLASLGGYVGDGVAASNLAARTLAHLVVNDKHPLTALPWVNQPSRKWEIEPLRYIGINGLLKISESMDNFEAKHNKPDRIRSFILNRFLGD